MFIVCVCVCVRGCSTMQVKTLMHEKSELQREMTALALENNALQELVGYLVENQREDDELCHASDEE